jgi:predicted Zn finger-like uncharacterized protein
MILTCPRCGVRYSVLQESLVQPRRVRCAACHLIWLFSPSSSVVGENRLNIKTFTRRSVLVGRFLIFVVFFLVLLSQRQFLCEKARIWFCHFLRVHYSYPKRKPYEISGVKILNIRHNSKDTAYVIRGRLKNVSSKAQAVPKISIFLYSEGAGQHKKGGGETYRLKPKILLPQEVCVFEQKVFTEQKLQNPKVNVRLKY